MAVTSADFNRIWASTSPLTPYSFSDANYKKGWNFVGSTPPARQMWDKYMNLADQKMQYLYSNYLPLSGGTMTGNISGDKASFRLMNVSASYDGNTMLMGGSSATTGAYVQVQGSTNSGGAGFFNVVATDGINTKTLQGRPNGTLTWDGKPVLYGQNTSYGNNGYFVIQNANTVIQWRRESVSANTSFTWTYAKPFADNDYMRYVTTSNNTYTMTTTATTMTVTNTGSSSAEIDMLAIGLMA